MGEMFKTEKELSDEEMFEQLISLGSQNTDKK